MILSDHCPPAAEPNTAHESEEREQAHIAESALAEALQREIRFQRKWKSLTMIAYATSSVGIITCSSAAMLFAALNHGMTAAIFAAISAILASSEKSLLLREKWKLHLSALTALEHLKIEVKAGILTPVKALEEFKRIGQSYAKDLPIESRIG